MHSPGDKRTFKLTDEQIDRYSEQLGEQLAAMGVERRNLLRVRLTMEEVLLRFRERFGEHAEVTCAISSTVAGTSVRVEHVGESFNPLGNSEDEGWDDSMLTSIGLHAQYSYVAGTNVLCASPSRADR